jgi:hypothetical protein
MTPTPHRPRHRGRDTGAVSLVLAVVFVAAVLFGALLYDQSRVLHANADAFDLAGKAARVGAQQLDPTALAAGQVRVDPQAATAAARAYLTAHRIPNPQIAVAGARVTVTVHQHIPFRIPILTAGSGTTVTQTRAAVATTGP